MQVKITIRELRAKPLPPPPHRASPSRIVEKIPCNICSTSGLVYSLFSRGVGLCMSCSGVGFTRKPKVNHTLRFSVLTLLRAIFPKMLPSIAAFVLNMTVGLATMRFLTH